MRRLRHPFLMFNTDPDEGGGGGGGTTTQTQTTERTDKAGGDKGFPENTPWRDMEPEEQVAYWQHQARKHENTAKARGDYDQLKAAADRLAELERQQMSPDQQAIEDAKREAREAALAEARTSVAERLVTAELRAALAGRLPADKIAGQVEFLDHSKFLTPEGEVDTDKVTNYANGIAPSGGTWPDMGQGNRGNTNKASGVSAGKDLFADRHKK